ncbi:MAG TPA: WHG domain-containing protein [Anaerolineales bacterium]|nr:WHG domain-containing protein [Anaerolineales bacterium]
MGRKKHIRLDKRAVLQAAVDLINAEGIASLTLSRLAEELGIRSPSLYNHVDGLPGLQRELAVINARLIADRLSEAAIGKSGAELFMSVAQAFRNYVKEYPGLYMSSLRASGTQSAPDENLVREEERSLKVGLAVMASLGLQDEDAIHALRAFRSMVHGFATLEVAGGFGLPQDCDESFRRFVEALTTGLKRM